MNRIIPTITSANGNLVKLQDLILSAVKKAEEYAFLRLKIDWDIDVLITNRMGEFIIPEDGVGGRTYSSDFIVIAIDESKITEKILTEMLVHELCHAARWGKNPEWINSLFDGIVNEGIATYFEAEYANEQKESQFFIKTITARSDEENGKILDILKEQLDNPYYDYQSIFFDGNDALPRWSGYSAGYFVVKKYLEKTGKKIEEAFADKYEDVKNI